MIGLAILLAASVPLGSAQEPSLEAVCGPAMDKGMRQGGDVEAYRFTLELQMSRFRLTEEQRVEYRRDCIAFMVGARRALAVPLRPTSRP